MGATRDRLLTVALCLGMSSGSWALQPTAAAWIDTAQAALGDRVALTLHLVHGGDREPRVPDIGALLQEHDIEVQERGRASTPKVTGESLTTGQQVVETYVTYDLIPYALGTYQLPSIKVAFITGGGTLYSSTGPIQIEVKSVRRSDEQGLRGIAPPLHIAGGIPLWFAGMLAALAVIGILLVLWWLDRRKESDSRAVAAPVPVDYEIEFQKIGQLGLVERGELKKYYTQLSDLLRQFLEESFLISALEQTTNEISISLRSLDVDSSLIREVLNFLAAADLVKFAKFVPELDNAKRAPAGGVAIVHSVEQFHRIDKGEMLRTSDHPAMLSASRSD